MSSAQAGIAGERALGDVLRGELVALPSSRARAARNGESPRSTAACASFASAERPRRTPRRGRCRRSRSAGRRGVTGTWPSSPARPSGPWKSLPPVDDRAADAGRDRQVDEVVLALARRRTRARRGRPRSCRDRGRPAGPSALPSSAASGMSRKLRPEVGRLHDHAGARVHRARARRRRCRRSRRRRLGAYAGARLARGVAAGGDDGVGALRRSGCGRRSGRAASHQAARPRRESASRRGRLR